MSYCVTAGVEQTPKQQSAEKLTLVMAILPLLLLCSKLQSFDEYSVLPLTYIPCLHPTPPVNIKNLLAGWAM